MKLILHIGTEKTGSTSLQHWMHMNDARLVADGVWYARCLRRPDNRWIAVYGRDADAPDDGFAEAGIKTPEAHARFCRRIEHELTAESAQARTAGCRVFVISSEHMHSRLVHDRCIRRLHDLLTPLFDDIEVVCYLRPQAEVLQSRLSLGATQFTFGPHELETAEREAFYYDYHALWKRWRSEFAGVSLVAFKRIPDVVQNFSQFLGIEFKTYTSLEKENERIDFRTALLIYSLQQSSFFNKLGGVSNLINLKSIPVEQRLAIGHAEANAVNSLYESSNRALADEVASIAFDDLAADLQKFPETGNAQQALQVWTAAEQLGYVVGRLNLELEIERCTVNILYAERAVDGRNVEKFKNDLVTAKEHLARAEKLAAVFSDVSLDALQSRILALSQSSHKTDLMK